MPRGLSAHGPHGPHGPVYGNHGKRSSPLMEQPPASAVVSELSLHLRAAIKKITYAVHAQWPLWPLVNASWNYPGPRDPRLGQRTLERLQSHSEMTPSYFHLGLCVNFVVCITIAGLAACNTVHLLAHGSGGQKLGLGEAVLFGALGCLLSPFRLFQNSISCSCRTRVSIPLLAVSS